MEILMKILLRIFMALMMLQTFTHALYASDDQPSFLSSPKFVVPTTAVIAAAGYLGYRYLQPSTKSIINVHRLADQQKLFPKDFAWGVATASTQNEESSNNNSWTSTYLAAHNKTELTPANHSCKSWTYADDDIEKAAFLGVNAFRFSIEWSRVQPTADQFDEQAIEHYVNIAQKLQALGIDPMVCLHHYSDPVWFLERGGFAQDENVKIFVRYCQKMYEALRPYVKQWIVISQPVAYALKGYHQGMQPPFIKNSELSDRVMLNVFKAHINVYDMMHTLHRTTHLGYQPQIGICHQVTQMKAYTSYSPLDHLAATFADRLYNKALLRFFTTGHLRTLKPLVDVAYIPDAPKKFDFFALSYYSPKGFSGLTPITPKTDSDHQTADPGRIIDKDGMYDALVQSSQLGKPIYVVESGIDPVNEDQRILLLNAYLSAIAQAINDGYDIKGYYYWTLMDNYEWGKPFNSTHFGLYHNRVIDEQGTIAANYKDHAAMLKQGGHYYKAVIASQKDTIE